MTNTTKTYTAKKNAIRAARDELGADAIPGVDFEIIEAGKGFGWRRKAAAKLAAAVQDIAPAAPEAAGTVPADLIVDGEYAGSEGNEIGIDEPEHEPAHMMTGVENPADDESAETPATTEHDLGAEIDAVQADIDAGVFDKPAAPGAPAGKKAAALAAAAAGNIPPAPDFSAKTHERFRGKLAKIVALVEARDIAGLEAMPINPVSTSPKAMARYRDLAVAALKAQAAAHAA